MSLILETLNTPTPVNPLTLGSSMKTSRKYCNQIKQSDWVYHG